MDEEEVDAEGNVVDQSVVVGGEPDIDEAAETIEPDDVAERVRAKYYVDDVEVWVTAEAVYHVNPGTDRLQLVEYRDFVAESVRTLFPHSGDLSSRWASRVDVSL